MIHVVSFLLYNIKYKYFTNNSQSMLKPIFSSIMQNMIFGIFEYA